MTDTRIRTDKRISDTLIDKENTDMSVVVHTNVPAKAITTLIVLPHVQVTDEGQEYIKFSLVNFHDMVGHPPPARRMLANLCNEQWTDEMVFVQIADGYTMPEQVFNSALVYAQHAVSQYMGTQCVLQATQAGYKSGSYVAVSECVQQHLAKRFCAETQGPDFANYLPLAYSSLSDRDIVVVPAVWEKAANGEDGNCPADPEVWGVWCQFRAIVVDDDGWPKLVGKGTAKPTERYRGDYRGVVLNDTCIKWHSGIEEGDMVIMAPTPVTNRSTQTPITWEMVQLFQNVPEVQQYFQASIDKAVDALLKPISQARLGNRIPLLRKLGGLKLEEDGKLTQADRNVISAVRSGMPWCKELEDRLGRIVVRELAERIAPSGGVYVRSFLAYQHDEIGKKACKLVDALCVAWRLPLTSLENVVAFRKKLRNGIVDPDVMKAMAGDSDGDRILALIDKALVQLFIDWHIPFKAGLKPSKVRRKGPLSPRWLMSHAMAMHESGKGIGMLTMVQHKLLVDGQLEMAAIAGQAAQAKPMESKHQVTLDGKPVAVFAQQATRAASALPTPHWREMQKLAKDCKSPRDLAKLVITDPESLIDHNWNYMVASVGVWVKANPLDILNLVNVAEMTHKLHGKIVVTNTESRWVSKWTRTWGMYWEDWHKEEKAGLVTPIGPFLNTLEEAGLAASVRKLHALHKWIPQSENSNGFLLKWHLTGKQWEKTVGLHESVLQYYKDKGYDCVLNKDGWSMIEQPKDA